MKKLILLFSLLFLLTSCNQIAPFKGDKYEIKEAKDGTIYKLNKKTGEMVIIKDGKVIPLEISQSVLNKQIEDKTLEKSKEWGEAAIPGKDLKVNLRTCWRDGKIYYEFMVSPFSSLEKMFNKRENDNSYALQWYGITIEFIDKNGFTIKKFPVKLWDMTRIVDNKGKVVTLSINSNETLSKSEYLAIASYTISWVLDNDLIPDRIIQTKYLDKLELKEKAFMDTFWGMSESEFRENAKLELNKPELFLRIGYPKVADEKRYKQLMQKNVQGMVGEHRIYYTFFDDRLFEILGQIYGDNPDELDKFIVSMLTKEYGNGKPSTKRDIDINSLEWENDNTHVSYWLMKTGVDGEYRYLAGFRIRCKPLYKAIEDIKSFEEKSNIF